MSTLSPDDQAALFPGFEPAHQEPVEELSAGGRRRVRQAQAVAAGVHPLALVLGAVVVMHADGNRDATAQQPGPGPHCGGCAHRGSYSGAHAGTFPKCSRFAPGSLSNSGATDCRAWWPACTQHQAAP